MPRANRISFSTSLRICVGLLIALFILFGVYVWSEKQIDAANTQRYQTRLLLDELRQSSDDLTRMVRSFVAIGDQAYIQHFQSILDIRDGKQSKPKAHHHIYWDLILAGKQPDSFEQEPPLALLEEIRDLDFTEQEFALIEKAKHASDQLAITEQKAIAMVKSAPANDLVSRAVATQMVYDGDYHHQKAEIMQAIDQVFVLTDQRTAKALEQTTTQALLLRSGLIVLGFFLVIMLYLTHRLFLNFLGTDPRRLHRYFLELGKNDFPLELARHNCPDGSVLAWLIEYQQKLAQLEQERIFNYQSLEMNAQVFTRAQEGIFFADSKATILDVNPAFETITGYSREEVIGQNPRILKSGHHDNQFYQAMWQSVQSKGFWRGEVWNRKKNGEIFAEILSIVAIYDKVHQLTRYLGMFTDITQIKLHQQEMEHIAFHDPLTQLPNRRLLTDRIDQALSRNKRSGLPLALCCLDLDGFKEVNDTFGHEAGDKLLIEVSKRLQQCVRSADTVARLGGDEFVVVLSEIKTREDAERTLARILDDLARPIALGDDDNAKISASIGYTLYPEDHTDPDTLLRHADQAMYVAKQAGKNRFHRFDTRHDKRIEANWTALARIDKALKRQEFRLFVQPKVCLVSGQVVGAEALIRWQHPVRGIVPPAEFLPLINDQDLAVDVGNWVIEQALQILQQWQQSGLSLNLSINVFARQLRQEGFANQLQQCLERYPSVPSHCLEIEIVESTALDDMNRVSLLISECKSLGVKFSLDDFGTGYSSLTYLKRLDVDTLKIDQSFVHDMLSDDNDLAITCGVINLARAFHYNTVAEGVESWAQAKKLKQLGCECAQGYVISHPIPVDEFVHWAQHYQMPDLDQGVLS